MSASLVGSEMCIRDRCRSRSRRPRPRASRPPRPRASSHPWPCGPRLWPCLLYTSDAADDM
eukprot:8794577-Alexandrium_andersonii.AAC.1